MKSGEKRLNHIRGITFAIASLFMLSACGQNSAPATVVEPLNDDQNPTLVGHQSKIIGSNELVKVQMDGSNVDSNLRPYLDAFGIIAIGQTGACTGTHIGNGYVITAGHCFSDEKNPNTQISKGKACADIKVYWGYRGINPATNKPYVSGASQCTQIVYSELSNDRDFAIFKVDQAPKASVPVSTATHPSIGSKITILGYPQARPLEWSQYCSVQSIPQFRSAAQFVHQCDTEAGNSGSTILSVSSSGVRVIGIHDGAAPDGVDYNYGTFFYDALRTLSANGINTTPLTQGAF